VVDNHANITIGDTAHAFRPSFASNDASPGKPDDAYDWKQATLVATPIALFGDWRPGSECSAAQRQGKQLTAPARCASASAARRPRRRFPLPAIPGVAASLARVGDKIHMCEMANATCGQCRATFDEDPGIKPEERKPCPVCGSTTRHISASVTLAGESLVSVSASVISGSVQSITAVSDLLLQAVIVPGDKTTQGRLIEAVAFPWFDVIAFLAKDPDAAFQIPSDKWEEIIAGAYKQFGFEEVTRRPAAATMGVMW
jgi:hypothetical protein